MTELLYGLFALCVLALVIGCFVYLFATRGPNRAPRASDSDSPPSREVAKKAEALSGSYRLSDLGSILEQLGVMEAWGMVLELRFTTVRESIQMIVNRNEVEICGSSLEPSDTDLFRRAAREAGLQARPGYTEGQYCMDVVGTWPKIASTIKSFSRSIYGVGDGEEVQVDIFS